VSRARTRPEPTGGPDAASASGAVPAAAFSVVARAPRTAGSQAGTEAGTEEHKTLSATEAAVNERLAAMPLDMPAMAAVSNLYRAAGAIRNHFEHTVLAPYNLTWTGWVVLWVVWIWEEIETRHVAAEAGISKGTLTGVAGTLEKRGLIQRRAHPEDARRVLMILTPAGTKLMAELFPQFNCEEAHVVAPLSGDEKQVLAAALRKIVVGLEQGPA
jgi:MarR family transcriptional regulator, organic hydroperoxide resistance regulator